MTTTIDPAKQAQITQLQTEIAALQSAIISGATRVSYDGKSVDYDDIQGLKMRLNYANTLLNQLINPGYRKPMCGIARFDNGLRRRPLFGYNPLGY